MSYFFLLPEPGPAAIAAVDRESKVIRLLANKILFFIIFPFLYVDRVLSWERGEAQ